MAAIPPPTLAAVDTNVLMELGADCASTHNALIRAKAYLGIHLIVTPTVIEELAYGLEIWSGTTKAKWAETALRELRKWAIEPVGLMPVGHGICEAFYETIVKRGYLPEHERHDALVLAEAGLWNAAYLITWDHHLLDIPAQPLAKIMTEKDLTPVKIISPETLNRYDPTAAAKGRK
ncbi:MAG: type II toxin-antitoxin system VapC family toxin [Verrucomicrobia bacterium]|nr:type II toxin-antitoxin system VapC family toxin [Verrucomicrobiota bacterium]